MTVISAAAKGTATDGDTSACGCSLHNVFLTDCAPIPSTRKPLGTKEIGMQGNFVCRDLLAGQILRYP